MSIAARATPLSLSHEMRSFIGRYTDKSFDWDAFPGSRGFPELERAHMRYIGTGRPHPPSSACAPRDSEPPPPRRFGAAPVKTRAFDPDSNDPRQQEFARHIVRYAEKQPVWDAGFARLVYVGEGGAPPGQYRM